MDCNIAQLKDDEDESRWWQLKWMAMDLSKYLSKRDMYMQ